MDNITKLLGVFLLIIIYLLFDMFREYGMTKRKMKKLATFIKKNGQFIIHNYNSNKPLQHKSKYNLNYKIGSFGVKSYYIVTEYNGINISDISVKDIVVILKQSFDECDERIIFQNRYRIDFIYDGTSETVSSLTTIRNYDFVDKKYIREIEETLSILNSLRFNNNTKNIK